MKRTLVPLLLAALLCAPLPARGQDPAFVGVLALAVEDNVATALGLSSDVKKQLNDLIAKREDEILKAGVDQLPEDEQKAKLDAFVAETGVDDDPSAVVAGGASDVAGGVVVNGGSAPTIRSAHTRRWSELVAGSPPMSADCGSSLAGQNTPVSTMSNPSEGSR